MNAESEHGPSTHQGEYRTPEDIPKESLSEELIRHWINERFAPEVLAPQEDLLEKALSLIQQQSLALDVLSNNPEDLTSDDHFRLMLIETEIEHMRYICRAYARCRMHKLDKFFDHCLMDPETRSRLSKVDLEYCSREQTLVHNLLYDSVLDQLPIKYRKLDEDHMIIRPDLDQGVFIIVRSSCGPVYLPHAEPLMLEKGSVHFIKYRSIKPFLESGHIKLG
ncbi:hypothetical protein PTTG_08819 [Puccinia triticina 1-1 BBBD Race 1]|uniref:DNA replication complex GINS protein SLD5 n=2 Tax=Puccinia triticina TaxID=208348 RepID=A0A0C4F6P9_PUCT1|nr:uncharacterized protein PtA15_2A113 [Puccinia triticina]OAV88859.1 hypothetical protein PTTG_08819 [Puccinia triticina 1-1 BBBD Race 1]WAQ81801.1 hypothetical protein PtA15_2A113 [Puccinia triticina]WAR52689.1 hypothetical protein PtB15_2B114 [Puccinia triticina]